MFKSVFTKYIVSFALIIAFSFVLLVFTLSSVITNYTTAEKVDSMAAAAEAAEIILDSYIVFSTNKSVDYTLLMYKEEIFQKMLILTRDSNFKVYIINSAGDLIFTIDPDYPEQTGFITPQIFERLISDPERYSVGRLETAFKTARYNVFKKLSYSGDSENFGILVSTDYLRDTELSRAMTGTMITASLWILLAALITVYVLSQRIIEPIKQLSAAAKNFGIGKFNTRVKVAGNDEIAELTRAFNNMADSLAKNEEMRNSFISNVSHDLRTPMTVIAGFVDGIRDGTIPALKRDEYLETISVEVRRLSRLVTSLLEISRMQSGERKLKITKFNVTEKARQALLSFEQRIDDKKINIEFYCDEDIFVSGDADLIHQAFYNLIDNAVKFTSENGIIAIKFAVQDKKAKISVSNTGEGIPEDEIPYLFERFYKSDRSRGLDKTGTGLGLYIVKTNINMHDEEIRVESKADKTTVFTFTLPLGKD